jgi:hypothetical protein
MFLRTLAPKYSKLNSEQLRGALSRSLVVNPRPVRSRELSSSLSYKRPSKARERTLWLAVASDSTHSRSTTSPVPPRPSPHPHAQSPHHWRSASNPLRAVPRPMRTDTSACAMRSVTYGVTVFSLSGGANRFRPVRGRPSPRNPPRFDTPCTRALRLVPKWMV